MTIPSGISQEEYDRFKRMAELSTPAKSGEIEPSIRRSRPDKVLLTGVPEIPSLEFDVVNQTADSSFGKLADPFEPNERQYLTGPIRGVAWRSKSQDASDQIKPAKATIAEQTETGDQWLML